MSAPPVEQLARALYETAPGTDGYRPLHETIPWKDAVMARETHIERARTILALLARGGVSPSGKEQP